MCGDAHWRICIDTGGTFTDCIGRAPDWTVHRTKVLSSSCLRARVTSVDGDRLSLRASWLERGASLVGASLRSIGDDTAVRIRAFDGDACHLASSSAAQLGDLVEIATGEPAPILGARLLTMTPVGQALPRLEMRLATTRGTNALLERAAAPTALFVTDGFEDLLTIGDQRRPDIFALGIQRPRPYAEWTAGVPGRIDANGARIQELDIDAARTVARAMRRAGAEVAAICLTHAWRNPADERQLRAVLHEVGFETVVASSDLAARIGLLRRAQTTVVDAALRPVLGAYLDTVRDQLRDERLLVMTSAGGLVHESAFRPVDGLLSGPAGGVVGALGAGRQSGYERIIAFDMGGTSTDVSRIDGDFEYQFEHTVGEARIAAPALTIETVAAGGGSICRFDDGRPLVGPESAGAAPGPACYGAGGPLTVTDANLLLGRLDPERFETPVNAEAASAALTAAIGSAADHDRALEGFLQIANDRMAEAIRAISVRRGYNPGDYALAAFGGAGPQHACDVADLLGVRTVLCPQDASLLSAVGLGRATIERFAERQALQAYEPARFAELLRDLEREARAALIADGAPADDIQIRRRIVSARYAGQGQTLEIDVEIASDLTALLHKRHLSVFGHAPVDRLIEIESARVVASLTSEPTERASDRPPFLAELQPVTTRRVRFEDAWTDTPVFDRDALPVGALVRGPALVREKRTTTVVPPRWEGRLDAAGTIILSRADGEAKLAAAEAHDHAFQRELIANRFSAIAEEMGELLQRTAISANVKERLDFSCGVLDAQGRLISAAPHIPVHLGALGLCVRLVAHAIAMRQGDVVVTNHPAFGGSHLPDITVITPVFEYDTLIGYVASRAHHAEIGGLRPGSMPPEARTLAEEGVAIAPMHLFDRGVAQWSEMERSLRCAAHPSRLVDENLADLRAQVAAGRRGAAALVELHRAVGAASFLDAVEALQDRSATVVGDAFAAIDDGTYTADEVMDDGAHLPVRITVQGRRATVDFTGAATQRDGNLNAPPAVVRSATAYVLRLLAGESTPLNDGLLEPVDLVLPEGSMLNPRFDPDPAQCCAVAGGNVETSQRVTCALIRALGLAADSQGTMNNILFGNDQFGFYETLGGGEGATAHADGASAVHTHMSNTAVTDAEILEQRCPVRVERFALRRSSGGAGANSGGDGLVRELSFLEPVSVSVVTQRRAAGAPGAAGGSPGQPGRQRVVRASGDTVVLRAVDGAELDAGDRLVIETPGGGGWGEA